MITQVQPAPGVADTAGARKVFARYVMDSSPRGTHPDEKVAVPWRLRLRDGRVVTLADVLLTNPPRWPVLTPHGSQVGYYRKPDGAWVVRDLTTGKVRAVPGKFLSGGAFCLLSPAGRFLVECDPTRQNPSYQIVDSVSGQTHTIPSGRYGKLSFSPDNAYVLVVRGPGNIEVYSTRTWTVVHRGTQAGALRMGGAVVAYIDTRDSPAHIRFWDLAAGRSTGTAIQVPLDEIPQVLVWDRADHLDLLSYRENKYHHGLIVRRSGYRWRRANAGMRVLDTFTVQAAKWKLAAEDNRF
ncbi:hypothetical protein [Nonomuraea rhizosphaerae]|uniref:hypothetical protein n=1 Tax=Nonomuraea rhizosphaerae TaxID=2665663 RepID=UPI001C5D1D54|nr:hypothetical protein [Nonomuraea rhizosphaerae]